MTFTPKTAKISEIANRQPDRINELESIFGERTNVYIDWANVYRRQQKLERHIDLRRLYQLLRSFSQIDKIRRYYGSLVGDKTSEKWIAEAKTFGYDVVSKSVKIMHHSIDVSGIPIDSSDVIRQYINKWLLDHLDRATIIALNERLKIVNDWWLRKIQELKCNFDVEIGVDMILDLEKSQSQGYYKTFVLWSWDSDFADIVNRITNSGFEVYVFSTSKRVSKELAETNAHIYDIKKIRDFICRNREISAHLSSPLIS